MTLEPVHFSGLKNIKHDQCSLILSCVNKMDIITEIYPNESESQLESNYELVNRNGIVWSSNSVHMDAPLEFCR